MLFKIFCKRCDLSGKIINHQVKIPLFTSVSFIQLYLHCLQRDNSFWCGERFLLIVQFHFSHPQGPSHVTKTSMKWYNDKLSVLCPLLRGKCNKPIEECKFWVLRVYYRNSLMILRKFGSHRAQRKKKEQMRNKYINNVDIVMSMICEFMMLVRSYCRKVLNKSICFP